MENNKIMKNFFIKIKAATRRLPISIYIHGKIKNLKFRKIIDSLFIPLGMVNYFMLEKKCSHNIDNSEKDIGIVAIVKNEAPYIKEWINYHKILGVKNFYIYNNESSDNLREVLYPFIKEGNVILRNMSGTVRQNDAYNDALNRYGSRNKYLIILDVDEFIFINNSSKTLLNILDNKFNKSINIGGIGVNWMIFGSKESGEGKLTTQRFYFRSKDDFEKNSHIKTIINPQKVVGFLNPHYPIYLKNNYAVNTINLPIEGPFCYPPVYNELRINHYFTKSKKEFIKKKNRGMADNIHIRDIKEFDEHDKNDVFDDSMKKYKDELEKENE